MFTGIIESVGTIENVEPIDGDAKLRINTGQMDMSDVALGDSISCNGVCLTAIKLSSNSYAADVSGETLKLTTLGNLAVGNSVNLEKALTPSTRLGGHLVSGHVDGVGEIMAMTNDSRSVKIDIKVPLDLAHYIAKKGSICIDGVSLTVNEIDQNIFSINLVPHTLQETTASEYKIGTKVNLEVDLLARYLERLLTGKKIDSESKITKDLLQNSGFMG